MLLAADPATAWQVLATGQGEHRAPQQIELLQPDSALSSLLPV